MELTDKCLCVDMRRDCQFNEAVTFECGMHGVVTIDRRPLPAPPIPLKMFQGDNYNFPPLGGQSGI